MGINKKNMEINSCKRMYEGKKINWGNLVDCEKLGYKISIFVDDADEASLIGTNLEADNLWRIGINPTQQKYEITFIDKMEKKLHVVRRV